MRTRQFGRFYVDQRFFEGMRVNEGVNLFAGMIVLDVREDFQADRREYRGVHEQFRVVKPGEMIPLYEATFKAGAIVPTWREVESLGTQAKADLDEAYRAAVKSVERQLGMKETLRKWLGVAA